ncbi:MAG: PLP-dependent transferase [Roseibium sp.]|uniref:aminotransferase class I/II-fold pyridoxal phosphate-dependent enzyme n=1 Tax=Roseibium sp. TaxID=1936156 RepID=UPI00261D178C|nr:aminotransferase class I/II-fold pyridoxal phosphate-dependent enzyme [Roseibium sp.]MCV0427239.1 PLP-dependent transferase [Roseibium sp.]
MADFFSDGYSIDTLLAAAATGFGGAVVPPIVQTSLFSFDNYQAFEDRMAGRSDDPLYTRVQNPTVAVLEKMVAEAEQGDAAVAFASGMAAISSTIFALVKPGDRIACVEHVYPDAYRLFERLLRPFGVEITYHSVEELESSPDLLRGAKLAYLESPNTVVFQAMDLPRVAAHAKKHGTLTVIDNSWATPVFQRPLTLGIDIVLHSASKYLSGHSDTVAGIVIARAELIDRIRDLSLSLLGGKLAPFEAFLLTRGLRTLGARMRQHQASANFFVDNLSRHSLVKRVLSPGPNTVPGLTGRSGLLSVELDDTINIPNFADALKLFRLGVSWGGFESLILPTQIALNQSGEENSLQRFGVSGRIVRLSLGLEDPADLWADFETALSQSAK